MIALSLPTPLNQGAACLLVPPHAGGMGPRLTHATWGRTTKSRVRLPQAATTTGHSPPPLAQWVPEPPPPPPPRTFFGLGIGDVQVAASRLQLLTAHDLALEVAQGDVEAVEGERAGG